MYKNSKITGIGKLGDYPCEKPVWQKTRNFCLTMNKNKTNNNEYFFISPDFICLNDDVEENMNDVRGYFTKIKNQINDASYFFDYLDEDAKNFKVWSGISDRELELVKEFSELDLKPEDYYIRNPD